MKDSLKGFLVIAALSVAAWYISLLPAVKALSFSSLIIGILLGMLYANTLRRRQPSSWDGGIKFCSKRMLRLGIILYGFRLTFQDVVAVGPKAVLIDCIVVVVTLLLGVWLGRRLGLDRETTLMTSTGSAICGAAAVLGAEPIAKGKPHQTAVAVSTVVIFGTLSMFLYPIMYRMGLSGVLDTQQMGVYTGSTLHEVAHVVGAGNAMGSEIATDSLIVKMVRVMLLVPVLIAMSWLLSRRGGAVAEKRSINVPWFAFIFLLMIAVNSGMHSAFDGEAWFATALKVTEVVSTFMLTLAMTALGSDTSIDKFRQAGAKPFYLAGALYVWLVVGGFALAYFLC
ncbi:MAG: YeiH family protein [Prevotella sp.]|nr:YeiH family protein [Prevotella sp.]MDY5034425.1 YeiH family protein [Prevotella sp.]